MSKFENAVGKIKKSNIAIFAGIIIFISASSITIYQGYNLFVNTYFSTIGYNQSLLSNINKLTAGENFDYFKSILGPPVFTNKISGKFTEHIFVFKPCFIQAVVNDSSGAVVMYSITIRDKDFNPIITIWDGQGKYIDFVLGKSVFSDLEKAFLLNYEEERFSSNAYAHVGAHDWFYFEKYWGANPRNYQNYIFADNMSGYENWEDSSNNEIQQPFSPRDPDIQKFRNSRKINTFAVTAPMVFLEEIGFTGGSEGLLIGPDYYQIRVLPDIR